LEDDIEIDVTEIMTGLSWLKIRFDEGYFKDGNEYSFS
jgi:hypothetical protein